jgi:hypothetical protein
MPLLQTVPIQCPYCGEPIELLVDCTLTEQEYIEDCSVCCQPINLAIDTSNPDAIQVNATTDNE